jgi:hypothetical protein
MLVGVPKVQIAARLGVHRNTINAWCAQPAFQRELRERLIDQRNSSGLRRLRQAGTIVSAVARLTSAALARAERDLDDRAAAADARAWVALYRAVVTQEHVDLEVTP